MRVEIDADKCIGSGACVIACPDVFSPGRRRRRHPARPRPGRPAPRPGARGRPGLPGRGHRRHRRGRGRHEPHPCRPGRGPALLRGMGHPGRQHLGRVHGRSRIRLGHRRHPARQRDRRRPGPGHPGAGPRGHAGRRPGPLDGCRRPSCGPSTSAPPASSCRWSTPPKRRPWPRRPCGTRRDGIRSMGPTRGCLRLDGGGQRGRRAAGHDRDRRGPGSGRRDRRHAGGRRPLRRSGRPRPQPGPAARLDRYPPRGPRRPWTRSWPRPAGPGVFVGTVSSSRDHAEDLVAAGREVRLTRVPTSGYLRAGIAT